jgi:hypothetical protein
VPIGGRTICGNLFRLGIGVTVSAIEHTEVVSTEVRDAAPAGGTKAGKRKLFKAKRGAASSSQ